MTTVRFSGALPLTVPTPAASEKAQQMVGPVTNTLAKAADRAFQLPDTVGGRLENYIQKQLGKEGGNVLEQAGRKIAVGVAKAAKSFSGMLLNYDYHEFPEVAMKFFGKQLKFKLSEPPMGVMLLLLYPFTMGPRLFRAYERGKKNNDFREVGDVLRRDGTAITLFLFAMDPLLRLMNKAKQRMDGLTLMTSKNQVMSYSRFANYNVTSEALLLRLLEEGNGRGLIKAAQTLSDRGLSDMVETPQLKQFVDIIQENVPKLVQAFENQEEQLKDDLAKTVVDAIQRAERLTAEAIEANAHGGSAQILKAAQALKGEFEGFVANYAKSRRLPQDIISFAIVVALIGWFPVWFNGFWNRKKYQEELAAKRAANAANFDPSQMYRALQQSSKLTTSFQQMG